MKQKCFLVTLVISFHLISIQVLKSQVNHFNASFSNIKLTGNNYTTSGININFQLEYNRTLNNYFSLGGYAGIGPFQQWLYEITTPDGENHWALNNASIFNYGVSVKLNLLQCIIGDNIPRLDSYISASSGLITLMTEFNNNVTPKSGNYFDFNLLGGTAIYFTKMTGIFFEAGYKSFRYSRGFNARYGITIRF